VLNDIGPVIEPKGLMQYQEPMSGKMASAASFHEAHDILRRRSAAVFPKLSDA